MCGTARPAERFLDGRERFAVVIVPAYIFEQREKLMEGPLVINPA